MARPIKWQMSVHIGGPDTMVTEPIQFKTTCIESFWKTSEREEHVHCTFPLSRRKSGPSSFGLAACVACELSQSE